MQMAAIFKDIDSDDNKFISYDGKTTSLINHEVNIILTNDVMQGYGTGSMVKCLWVKSS